MILFGIWLWAMNTGHGFVALFLMVRFLLHGGLPKWEFYER